MKKTPNGKTASGIAALVIFCVFALCALGVLLTGANSYRSLTQRDAQSYDSRTVVQYLSTKVRQTAAPESVEVAQFEGVTALCFSEELQGNTYITRIYCYDGWLKELFTAGDADLLPEDGERIAPLAALEISREGNVLHFAVTDVRGETAQLVRLLRGGEVDG